MPYASRPGEILGDRYRLVDLLVENDGGRFWRAHDRILERHVAIHVIRAGDPRAPALMQAARRSATVNDRRVLRVLDAEIDDEVCYVVNEWGWGASLDIAVASKGPLTPRRAAWLVAEVAESVAVAHALGVGHGRLAPENVLVDRAGGVRLIGLCVDAALHGLAGEDPEAVRRGDVQDLAGLLYCALTGRWAGASESAVEPAPLAHGEVMRPRQVRAGIPRPLDALCDTILHAGSEPSESAQEVAELLAEFVGDPAGMPDSLLAAVPDVVPDTAQVVLPPVPEIVPHHPEPPPAETGEDRPTEAGMPIFGENDDDVSWLERRSAPKPPPPFDEPPERPLFAPEPADGTPARRARPDAEAPSSEGFWPWGDTGAQTTTATATVPGTRASAKRSPTDTVRAPATPRVRSARPRPLPRADPASVVPAAALDEREPGRRWLLLAGSVVVVVLLVVAVVVGFGLDTGRDDARSEPGSPETTDSAPAPVLRGLQAVALDPQGDDGDENNVDAPLAVDGDRATTWSTQGYDEQLGPNGLKTGVGLTVDLGSVREIDRVVLHLERAPSTVELFVSDAAPDSVEGLQPVAEGTATGERLALEVPATDAGSVTGRYLVVWFTSLPEDPSDGQFRGTLAEVTVRGR